METGIRTAGIANAAGSGLMLASENTSVRQQSALIDSLPRASGQHGSDAHSLSKVHIVMVVAPESSHEKRTSDAVGDASPTTRIMQSDSSLRSIMGQPEVYTAGRTKSPAMPVRSMHLPFQMSFRLLIRASAAAGLLCVLAATCTLPAFAAGWAVGGNGLVIRSTDGGQTFTPSSPTTTTLNGVYFLDELEGWAVGNSGIAIHTTDGGDHWTQTTPGSLALNSVYFADANHGWMVGDSGKILHTINGGANWTTSTPTAANLYSVFALDNQLAWAVGKGVVLRTVNGGATWASASPSTQTLRGVFFVNDLLGFAVGTNGAVLKSTNSGYSWTATTPTTSDLYSTFFVNATTGWAVGEAGAILSTTNGGTSWTTQRAGSVILRSVFFIDDLNGWAVGQSGTLVETSDGGAEWSISHPASVSLNGVFIQSIPDLVTVKVSTNPAGRSFSVDGVDYTAAQTFHWDVSSLHTISTTSPQTSGVGTRFVWESWSDDGTMSHDVSPATSTSYVANFTTQYQLTMQTAVNGTTSPPTGWFDAGATVSILATPAVSYGFNGWTGTGSGSYSGWANPANVKMNAPITETPAFGANVTVVVKSSPAGRSFVVDGTTYSSQQTFSWPANSSHVLDAPSPQGTSGEFVFSYWSDTGAASHTITPVSNTTCTAYFTGGSNTPAFPTELSMLQNAPNPATSMTDIRYGLPASSDVTIELFDVTGRRVFVDRVNDVASGWQSYRLDVAGGKPALRTGIYFVRVTALGVRRESRMVVLR